MRVLLTGATGFVGSHMLERLAAAGHSVRALVRDPASAQNTIAQRGGAAAKALEAGGIELVRGDVVRGTGLDQAAAGCEAAIHLVGVIVETGGATFENAHFVSTRNVVASAKAAAMRRFVQMSALGARPDGVSGYQTTKWRAEELVRSSGLSYCILRPSIIFGPRDGFVSQMVDVMRTAPLVRPVPGNGQYRFRPIYIDNVVDCFLQALTSDKAAGQTVTLVGPDEMTLEQLLAEIAECVGIRKPAVKVPYPVMYMNAAIMGTLLKRPPVTTDQLRMLKEGSTADPGPMLDIFDLKLVGLREGLRRYLCNDRTEAN